METIHNTTPITETKPVEIKISEFNVKDNNNLIVSIVNAPVGKLAIQSSFWTINDKDEKSSSIPLGHAIFSGSPEQIITMLLKAAATVLLKGQSKNPEQDKKVIIKGRN